MTSSSFLKPTLSVLSSGYLYVVFSVFWRVRSLMRCRFMKGSTMRARYRRIFSSANPLLRWVRIAGLRNRKDKNENTMDYVLSFVALIQLPAGVISHLLSPELNLDLMVCSLLVGGSSIALELFTGRLNRLKPVSVMTLPLFSGLSRSLTWGLEPSTKDR